MEEVMDWKKISKEIEIKQRYKYIPIHIWRKPSLNNENTERVMKSMKMNKIIIPHWYCEGKRNMVYFPKMIGVNENA